ncbi:MAG: CBS domain-containing protein [Candidatus Hodarchaeales archaeon]
MNADKEILVRDVMTKNVLRAKGTTPLTTCAKLMLNYKVGSIIIDEESIITKTDILRVIGEGDLGLISAGEIASNPLVTCFPDDNLEDTMQKMAQESIEKLVVFENEEIIGIISSTDILRTAPGLLEIKRQQWLLNRDDVSARVPKQEIEGYCEDCGNYTAMLISIGRLHLCNDCFEIRERREMEDEEEETF